jgi:hypothetical protein
MHIRNYQFATMLTEISKHKMTPQAERDLEIIKMTMMTIGREAATNVGDDPDSFSDGEGALALLVMSIHWMLKTDLLVLEGGE